MIKTSISPEEARIIQKICTLQIESHLRLISNNSQIDVELARCGAGVNKSDWDFEILNSIEEFEAIQKNPEILFNMGLAQFSVFKDQLLNYKEEIEEEFPNSTPGLWHKFFLATFILEHLN